MRKQMAEDIIRKLPFSAIAEQSLLGSIIIAPDALDEVVGLISPEDFYISEHVQIFSALKELFANNPD